MPVHALSSDSSGSVQHQHGHCANVCHARSAPGKRTNPASTHRCEHSHVGHKEWFTDLIHPNDSGAAVLAAVIYSGVRDQPGVELSPPLLSATPGSPGRIHVSWPAAQAALVLE